MPEVSIEDVQSFIRNKSRIPIMTVDSIGSADYNTMKDFVLKVN